MRKTTYTVVAREGKTLVSVTVSPRPFVWKRVLAWDKSGIAIVQALSSKELAMRLLKSRDPLETILKDPAATYRQALLVKRNGKHFHFTGLGTLEAKGFIKRKDNYCIGNGLLSTEVLRNACKASSRDPLVRALEMVKRAEDYGGNAPGARSAALVYLGNTSFTVFINTNEPYESLKAELLGLAPLKAFHSY